jgi:hypothetical protein
MLYKRNCRWVTNSGVQDSADILRSTNLSRHFFADILTLILKQKKLKVPKVS